MENKQQFSSPHKHHWSLTLLLACLSVLSVVSIQPAQAQWISLNAGSNEDLNEVFMCSRDTAFVVGTNGTILKTNNGGQSWISLSNGLPLHLNDLYFLNRQEGWLVGDSGLLSYTADGGQTWSNRFLQGANSIALHSVFALNSSTVFVGGSNWNGNEFLFKSTNGGQTFQPCTVEAYTWLVDITKIGMVNDSIGYALTRGMVLKTKDAGANWKIADTASVFSGSMFSILEDFAIFPNNDTLFVCGWYPAYFGKSSNAANQMIHDYRYDLTCLDFLNPQVGYVGGWGSLYKTIDGAQSFIDASAGNASLFTNALGLDFFDEQLGMACGKSGLLLKTSNGGSTGLHQEHGSTIKSFPNPTQDMVFFSELAQASISTLQGQELMTQGEARSIDISSLPSGVYILRLRSKDGKLIQRSKIIKK